ncbi:MAG TPA: PHP domain-containing protein [Gemmatimonadaceae bacterium]|nr:PHP domain-containing protein [Gemmatimonadaceae bacterium]
MTAPSTRGGVDLHMHSTASDGSASPSAVVAAARAASLATIALTDHDTLAGVAEARAAGDAAGVRVIAGVELSAVDGAGEEMHVLGLHIARPDGLQRALDVFRAARRARALEIVARLNALSVPVTADAVLAQAGEGAIGRPHVARALVAGGWAKDIREAFERWLGAGRPAFVEKRRLTIPEACALIHDAGGLAIYAHPGGDGTRDRLRALAAQGLDGVEVRHPGHSPADTARLAALADELDLVPSGGSDWHGAAEGSRTIGCMQVPPQWLERQEARVRERVAQEVHA